MSVNHFSPLTFGWETTLACNMKCKHCGSIAGDERPIELTTDQAMIVCEQLDAFPETHVTLTGGETFVRKDWPIIAQELVKRRGSLGIISNAWLIDQDMIKLLKEIEGSKGRINIGLSLDGDKIRHDHIRREGSYDRVIQALNYLKEAKIFASLITVINPDNLNHLDHVRDVALESGAYAWQLQVTSEYGRAAETGELVLDRRHYAEVVDKVSQYRKELNGSTSCNVYTADCLGYFGPREKELRSRAWHGCHAGIRCLGMQSNGNLKGCLSLLEDVFIEGNVLESSIKELWERPDGFAYNRGFTPDELTGPCAKCRYGHFCRGGCHSTAHSILGTVNESPYCIYADEQGWFEQESLRPEIEKKAKKPVISEAKNPAL